MDEPPKLIPLATLCKELPERAYFVVDISLRPGNPVHRAILHTGFLSGSYREVWNASYDSPAMRGKLARAIARVITPLADMR